jgi:hypothetical protein
LNPALIPLLNDLFEGLANEFNNLLEQADKMDHFYLLSILADVEGFTERYKTSSAFVMFLLDSLDKSIKRLFTKFIVIMMHHYYCCCNFFQG